MKLAALVLVVTVWTVAGCASAPPAGPIPQASSGVAGTLRPGDFVRIAVWPESELSGEFTVEESGDVYLPVIGEVRAADVPLDELRGTIRDKYRTDFRDAIVTVTPAFTVGVLGEVQRPGLYVITPTVTLFDVIGMAGGFRAGANEERVRVVREGEVVQINAVRALRSGTGLDPLTLHSGDQIIVEPGGIGWGQMRDVLALFQSVTLIITLIERFN